MDYITVSTDTAYLEHTLCFLHTLRQHAVSDITAHVRGVSLHHTEIDRIKRVYDNIIIINDSTDLSKQRNKLKEDQSWDWTLLSDIKNNSFTYSDFMCYINNMRFDNICDLLEDKNTSRVINMDVDQLFVNEFDLDELFTGGDILTFNENAPPEMDVSECVPRVWIPEVWTSDDTYETSHPLNDESMIGIVNSELTRRYFHEARDMIHEDFLNWDADYNIINQLYNTYTDVIDIRSPSLRFCDRWIYSNDSVIWNGAGNNRTQVDKYREMRDNILYEIRTTIG
jgi:hypothetical protein